MGAIRVGEKGDGVFAVSLNDREVKEVSVSVTFDCPTFFWLFEYDRLPLYFEGVGVAGEDDAEGWDFAEKDGETDRLEFALQLSGVDLKFLV
jgi:hypothetical protein